jgi:hypothetical protein
MCRVSRVVIPTLVMLVAAIACVSSAQDVNIGVHYELDASGKPTKIEVINPDPDPADPRTNVISYWDHLGRWWSTEVEWKLIHPDPKAENTDWTLEWKEEKSNFEVCDKSIRFVSLNSEDVALCDADSHLTLDSDWHYRVVATSTNGAYEPVILDPAIVFRKGLGVTLVFLVVVLAALVLAYRLFLGKQKES